MHEHMIIKIKDTTLILRSRIINILTPWTVYLDGA